MHSFRFCLWFATLRTSLVQLEKKIQRSLSTPTLEPKLPRIASQIFEARLPPWVKSQCLDQLPIHWNYTRIYVWVLRISSLTILSIPCEPSRVNQYRTIAPFFQSQHNRYPRPLIRSILCPTSKKNDHQNYIQFVIAESLQKQISLVWSAVNTRTNKNDHACLYKC